MTTDTFLGRLYQVCPAEKIFRNGAASTFDRLFDNCESWMFQRVVTNPTTGEFTIDRTESADVEVRVGDTLLAVGYLFDTFTKTQLYVFLHQETLVYCGSPFFARHIVPLL